MWFLGGALYGDFPELLFPLGLIIRGLAMAILVQSQGIISFSKASVAMGTKVAVGTGP